MYGQNWSPSPQYPNWLQHRPKVDPRQVTLLPHRPSRLEVMPAGMDTVGDADVVVLLVVVVVVVVVVVGGEVGGVVIPPDEVVLLVVVVVPLVGGFPGWPGTPKQAPNALWQPAPQ
jgi:hypothetical protein